MRSLLEVHLSTTEQPSRYSPKTCKRGYQHVVGSRLPESSGTADCVTQRTKGVYSVTASKHVARSGHWNNCFTFGNSQEELITKQRYEANSLHMQLQAKHTVSNLQLLAHPRSCPSLKRFPVLFHRPNNVRSGSLLYTTSKMSPASSESTVTRHCRTSFVGILHPCVVFSKLVNLFFPIIGLSTRNFLTAS